MDKKNLAEALKASLNNKQELAQKWDNSKKNWYEIFITFGTDDSTNSIFVGESIKDIMKEINSGWFLNREDKWFEDGKENKIKSYGIDVWEEIDSFPTLIKVLVY